MRTMKVHREKCWADYNYWKKHENHKSTSSATSVQGYYPVKQQNTSLSRQNEGSGACSHTRGVKCQWILLEQPWSWCPLALTGMDYLAPVSSEPRERSLHPRPATWDRLDVPTNSIANDLPSLLPFQCTVHLLGWNMVKAGTSAMRCVVHDVLLLCLKC